MMETINIEVSSNVAEAYRNFTVNQRQQIEGLINGLLSQLIQERSLEDIIDDMPHQVDAIGLSVTDWIITKLGNSDSVEDPSNKAEQEQARQRFKSHAGSISLGHATGIDNESVDNDMSSPLDHDSSESQGWEVFALNNLNECYSEDEPIYDLTHLKENNSDYERR